MSSKDVIDPFPTDSGEKREYLVRAGSWLPCGNTSYPGGTRLRLPVLWVAAKSHPAASCPHQIEEATASPKVAEKAPDEAPAELGARTRSIKSPPKRKAKKKKS